jgi:hypothetical protein
MGHSFPRSLTVGVAAFTAATIAFVPSVKEPAPAVPTVRVATSAVQLAAQVQPSAAIDLPGLLVDWFQHYVVPPSAGAPFPSPQFPPVVAPTSIGSSIIWVYNAVEPWARWITDVAAYAVGWIPYVGWLAPQIPIFYNFGERIARSITYNIAYWLDGNISFTQGLVNVGVDTVNAFIQLGIDQWNFWLWPLPPLPPIFPGATALATAELTTPAAATVTEDALSDAPKLNKNGRGAQADVVGEEADADASAVVADEAAEESQKKSEVEAVKEAKEPKTTTSSSEVAAQGEVRGAPIEKKTESANVNNGDKTGKKGEEGQTAEATSGASASAATNDDTGAKHDKKDGTGKK